MKKLLLYGVAGLRGIFVVSTLGIIAPTFTLCGVLCPIAGLVKLTGYFFHFDVPFVIFQWGDKTLHPIPVCILSVIAGGLLYGGGVKYWRALRFLLAKVTKKADCYTAESDKNLKVKDLKFGNQSDILANGR